MATNVAPRGVQSASASHPAEDVDVVVLGEALVDLFPDEGELHKPLEDVERFSRHLGGAPANFAVGLAKQGIAVALCTMVGSDAFGRFVATKLAEEGVVTDCLGMHGSARTGVTFVALGRGGARSFLFYRHPSADMLMGPGHIVDKLGLLRRGEILHIGSSMLSREPSRAATMKLLEHGLLPRSNRLLSMDVNHRTHLWPEANEAGPLLRKVIAGCDLVKLTPEELLLLGGTEDVEAAAARIRASGPSVVVVTMGERGAYLDSPAGTLHLAAEAITAIDTTGAGDAFWAGYIGGLRQELAHRDPEHPTVATVRERLRGLDMKAHKRALLRGNHLGAQACLAVGATAGLPRLENKQPMLGGSRGRGG